jgi:hypothetical protein
MATDDETDEKTVKELIDAATRAELERWFGLPSFTQVEEQKAAAPDEDPDVAAVRERRQKAIEAVDPAMLEAHRKRTEPPEWLLRERETIQLKVNPAVTLLDYSMIDRGSSIADPREVEISEELRDDLHDCTPQALLRDLHRPELDFDKTFEVVDYAAENHVDAVGIVKEVMRTAYKVNTVVQTTSIFIEGREILRELRTLRLEPWSVERLAALPNRRVSG